MLTGRKGPAETVVTKKLCGARFPGSLWGGRVGGINLSLNKLKLSCLENAQAFAY